MFPDTAKNQKQNKVTKLPQDASDLLSFFRFDRSWLLQLKESFEAAVATFANPCPAVVSHLGVSKDIEVSLEGDRNSAAVLFFFITFTK